MQIPCIQGQPLGLPRKHSPRLVTAKPDLALETDYLRALALWTRHQQLQEVNVALNSSGGSCPTKT